MSSLFLSSVYERGHVNALSDNTRNILYYLDVELTKNTALACLKYFIPSSLLRLLPCSFFYPVPSVNNGLTFTSRLPCTAAPNSFILIFWSHTSQPFFITLMTNAMSLREMMSINNNPLLFLNSLFIAPSECASQTYLAKNIYNISLSSGDG
jgi:hypothetical protein